MNEWNSLHEGMILQLRNIVASHYSSSCPYIVYIPDSVLHEAKEYGLIPDPFLFV